MTRRTWIITGGALAIAAALAIALIIVIATGDDDGSNASALTPPAAGGQFVAPSEDVQQCLEQKGIQAPQPGQAPSGDFDPDQLRQALEDCGADVPDSSQGGGPFIFPGSSGSGSGSG